MVIKAAVELDRDFKRLLWINSLGITLLAATITIYMTGGVSNAYVAIPMVVSAVAALFFANNYSVYRAGRNYQRSMAELNDQIAVDELTGAMNRKAGMARYHQEVRRARRSGASLTVAMVDADNFKLLNDTYGHLAGDRVLAAISRAIISHLRTSDVVMRYGGEEFLLVMPDTYVADALVPLERLRESISTVVVEFDIHKIRTSVSIGVASFDMSDADEKALIDRADKALYRAKHKGRNRVEGDGVITTPLPRIVRINSNVAP